MENFMSYYKDTTTGDVYAYDDQQIEDGWVKEGLVPMTPEEVEVHKNPKLTLEQASSLERQWRDSELAKADIEINKATDSANYPLEKSWRNYRIELRDWPENPDFPSKLYRPTREVVEV